MYMTNLKSLHAEANRNFLLLQNRNTSHL